MKTHYLPQFLLKEFTGERLYELDKNTGNCEPRNVTTGGQMPDFYLPEIETGLMREHDQAACNVLREQVYRRERISLPGKARWQISEWIALFMARVPRNHGRAKAFLEEFNSDPENQVKLIFENPERYIRYFQENMPDSYAEAMTEFGDSEGRHVILNAIVQHVRLNQPKIEMDATELFCEYIASQRFKRFARFLHGLRWVWLRTDGGFVIGDNPLCRWDLKSGIPDVGLRNKKVEITIPLSKSICIWMRRDDRHGEEMRSCGRDRTDTLNRRQITSAIQKVYGPNCKLLQPDNKDLDYGF